MEQTKNEDKSTVTEEQKQESTSVANQTSDVKQTNETNTPKVNPEKLRGLCVSKRPWKAPKTRFSSQSRIVKTSLEHRNRIKAYEKAVKAIERELKAKIEEERKKEIRRIQQKRQAKMERLIKEQAKKPLKQAQKSKGKRQRLSAKELKKAAALRNFTEIN